MKRPDEITPMTPKQRIFFTQMYSKYKNFLFYIAKQNTSEYGDLEDIVQDAWCRLMKQVETLMGLEEPALRSYISRAVESACRENWEKKHMEYPQVPLEENTFDLERTKWDMISDLYLREQIRKLQDGLSDQDWLALEGKYYFGYSNEELGKQMGVKTNSVHTLMGRIRLKAKRILLSGSLIGGGGNER